MNRGLWFRLTGTAFCLLLLCNVDEAWSLVNKSRNDQRAPDTTRSAPTTGQRQDSVGREIRVPDITLPQVNIPDPFVPDIRVPTDQRTTSNSADKQRGRDRDFPEIKVGDVQVPEINMRDPGGTRLQRSTTATRSSPAPRRVSKTRQPSQAAYSAGTAAPSAAPAPRQVSRSNQPKKKFHSTQTLGTVSKILDAGTVEVALANGRTERVRYQGFDSSSLDDPSLLELNRQLTEGKIVLIDGRRGERDDQGNLIAKVYVGNADSAELTLVNSELGKKQTSKTPDKTVDAPTS